MKKTASTRAVETSKSEGSEGVIVPLEGTSKRALASPATERPPKKTKLAIRKMSVSRATCSSTSLASPEAPAQGEGSASKNGKGSAGSSGSDPSKRGSACPLPVLELCHIFSWPKGG